ncbi:hypothetical protein Aduo_016305 [Ancylostoma duodenale]
MLLAARAAAASAPESSAEDSEAFPLRKHQGWVIQERPPFKRHNLKALHYFKVACEPADAIQSSSVRMSSRGGKKEELRDLPERIVSTLVNFMLEAMGVPAWPWEEQRGAGDCPGFQKILSDVLNSVMQNLHFQSPGRYPPVPHGCRPTDAEAEKTSCQAAT